MVRIILTVCFVPLVPILYAMLRNESTFKKNISLGVTLPHEAREDSYVADMCRQYQMWLTVICAALLLVQIPFYFIPATSVFTLAYMIWILLVIALPYLPFFHYHHRLKAYKEQKGWSGNFRGAMVVDLRTAAENRRSLSAWWFALPVVLSVIPVIAETGRGTVDSWAFVLMYILLTLMVASFYLFYRIINRQRSDVVEENPTLNQTLTRIRRYNWSKMWLWMAWLTGGFNLCLWLLIEKPRGLLIMITIYMVLCLLVTIQTEFTARRAQHRLTAESGRGSYIDDDRYWPHGMFYYNPNDKHLIINNRIGIGTTVNMGRPAGRVLIILCAVVIALLPLAGVWMLVEERAPLAVDITGQEVIATHIGAYHVALDDIRSAELLEALPTGTVRLVGTGLENLSKGRYRVPGIGQCEVNLDPTIGPYLVIRTDERTYLFGTRDPQEIVEAYRAIQSSLGLRSGI